MSETPISPGSALAAAAASRLADVDPLLAMPVAPPGCGTEFTARGPGGQLIGSANCEHWRATPGTTERTWGAERRFKLAVSIAGPDTAAALDQLLAQWRAHLAGIPGAAHDDTAAIVTWPSRDVDGVRALQRHGLAPISVIAARTAGSALPAGIPRLPGDVRIRRAGPADVAEIVRLGMGLVRFDELFGAVRERPESEKALGEEMAGLLSAPVPLIWLAERDGTAVGMLTAEPPQAAAWIAPLTARSPVCYLEMMYVSPDVRGGGIGAALASQLNRDLDAAGVAVTLLHYGQVNPLSVPFWSQQGYRPLWTSWEAEPASMLR